MGNTYTRQSSFTDGDVITADLFNNEYDQLLAAFAASTGHTHDGTAAEGGPITKLLGTGITIGDGTSGTDITVTFDGETNDGELKWMEDEDYFEFSDDILIASTEKLQFRDTAIYINSSADGQLDLVADTEIQIAATTVDINGNVDVSGTLTVAGAVDFGDAALSNVGAVQLDSIAGDADSNTSIAFSGSDVITITAGGETQITFNNGSILPTTDDDVDLGSSSFEFKDLYIDGTAYIDTASVDALTVSGSTTLGATSFGDADITNVGSIALDTITNDGTDITLDSGGDIILDAAGNEVFFKSSGTSILEFKHDSGDAVFTVSTADKNFTVKGTDSSSAITALDIDMALAGKATFNGDVVVGGDLTISGDDLTMATNTSGHLLIADGTNFNPTGVGDLSEISTVANDDVFLAVDTSGGGLKKITRSTIVSGLAVSGAAISNVVEDSTPQLGGNLDMNGQDIVTTSNADIDLAPNGTGKVVVKGNTNPGTVVFNCESNSHGQTVKSQPHSASVTNVLTLPPGGDQEIVGTTATQTLTNKTMGATSFGDNDITNVGDIALDSISADATDINVAVSDNSATALTIKQGSDAYLIIDTANSSESVSIGTGISGTAITLGHSTSEVTVADNLTVTGDLTVSGTTTTVNSTTVNLNDHNIVLDSGNSTSAVINGAGITIEGGSGDDATFTYNTTGPKFELKLGSSHEDLQVDQLIAASLDISGDIDVDGTTNLDVVDIDGAVDMASTLGVTGVVTANAGVVIDNITIDGTEIDLSSGDLTVDVAGDIILDADGGDFKFQDGGTEILRITNSSSDVIIRPVVDAKDIIFQQRDGTEVARIEDNGTFNVVTDKLAINGTAITSTAAELNILDGVTSTAAELNILDGVTATASELNLLDGDTSVGGSITLADADGFVVNDGGTMKTIPASDVKTYAAGSAATKGFAIAMAIVFG